MAMSQFSSLNSACFYCKRVYPITELNNHIKDGCIRRRINAKSKALPTKSSENYPTTAQVQADDIKNDSKIRIASEKIIPTHTVIGRSVDFYLHRALRLRSAGLIEIESVACLEPHSKKIHQNNPEAVQELENSLPSCKSYRCLDRDWNAYGIGIADPFRIKQPETLKKIWSNERPNEPAERWIPNCLKEAVERMVGLAQV